MEYSRICFETYTCFKNHVYMRANLYKYETYQIKIMTSLYVDAYYSMFNYVYFSFSRLTCLVLALPVY